MACKSGYQQPGEKRGAGQVDRRAADALGLTAALYDAVAAAAAFRRDCGHHDNLVLVTEIVGHIADRLVCGDDWLDATKQFRGLVGGPWWEVSGEQNHEMQKKLRSVAARSAALLRASSVAACSAADAEIFYRGRDGSDADAGIPGRDDDDDVIGDTPAAAAARASYATTKEIPAVLDKLALPLSPIHI